ncbi:MAG: hypothetical protein HKN51_05195 [Saprospiraceae bacterium]|nr:hypothetical protein [Bacteroidia bacterium]NNE14349.1 hypothetical protein [Saprospiraceae bacterium]
MKFFTCLYLLFAMLGSNQISAQFKLKKLDDVVVSMSENETIKDFQMYLANYFDRIEMTQDISEKSNFTIVSTDSGKYLQGEGVNKENKKVVYRIKVSISDDKQTITKLEDTFKIQICIATSCASCTFDSESSCKCNDNGDCEHDITI